jgi:diguanylate cyclase (GGDEF)-like protein
MPNHRGTPRPDETIMTAATPLSLLAPDALVHVLWTLLAAPVAWWILATIVLLAAWSLRLRQGQLRIHAMLLQLAGDEAPPTTRAFFRPGMARSSDAMLHHLRANIARLEHAARHDPMTGLLNSGSFKQAVQAYLAWRAPGPVLAPAQQGALLVLGVNALGKVNDSLGHAGGDRVLLAVAERLQLACAAEAQDRAAPIIGRLGGDEFLLFLPGCVERAPVERFVQRLTRVIGEACHVGAQSFRVKLSVGIALSLEHGQHYDQMLAAADTAMNAAGPASHGFYTPDMRAAADQMLAREMALRTALAQGEFCLHYQPQLNLATGRVDSVEALIRWNHPTRGLVYPADFIPFVEDSGLIDDIGDWVLLEAVRQAAHWLEGGRPLRVSVNVSPRQMWRVELIPMVRACLSRFALPPHLLEIEITEATIMRGEDFSLQRIEGLRRDGVSVALDDFGTGYSNLAQLMTLPMDRLKLDKSLVDGIVTDPRQQVVTGSIIHMARELGFEVVAEGVETQAQMDLLQTAGCHTIQGYHIARPLDGESLMQLLHPPRKNPEIRVA